MQHETRNARHVTCNECNHNECSPRHAIRNECNTQRMQRNKLGAMPCPCVDSCRYSTACVSGTGAPLRFGIDFTAAATAYSRAADAGHADAALCLGTMRCVPSLRLSAPTCCVPYRRSRLAHKNAQLATLGCTVAELRSGCCVQLPRPWNGARLGAGVQSVRTCW